MQFEKDDVNIVLDGPDREIERTSNGVVGMAVGHKFQDSLFTGSEPLQIAFSHQGPRRSLGNKGSASRHLADSSHDLFISGVFDHVPRRSRIQGRADVPGASVARKHEDARIGPRRENRGDPLRSRGIGKAPISCSLETPVTSAVALFTSVIFPSGLMVTRGSRLASIRLRV